MKKEIMNKLFDKSWKKVLIVFLIVFIIVFGVGVTSVNYLNDAVNNNHIHTEIVNVTDKLYGDKPYSDYYLIIGNDSKTYGITNHDGYGQKMFNSIQVGQVYEFVVKEPEMTDINQQVHIMQVHNVTG